MATIENADPDAVALSVQMAPAQTAPGFEVRDSDGNPVFSVAANGSGTFPDAIQPYIVTSHYSSLQNAVDSLPNDTVSIFISTGGGTIFHPTGTQVQTGAVHIPSNVTIVGDNRSTSILSWPGTEALVCRKCGETIGALTFTPTQMEPDSGSILMNNALRDLHIKGNHSIDTQCAITNHHPILQGNEATTFKSGYHGWYERLLIDSWGKGVVFVSEGTSPPGSMGLHSWKNCKIQFINGGNGFAAGGDGRCNLYEDIYITSVTKDYMSCMEVAGHYAPVFNKCVFETAYQGLSVGSSRAGVINGTYLESLFCGINLNTTTLGFDVAGTFGVAIWVPFTLNNATRNNIHNGWFMWSGDGGCCTWYENIAGDRFYGFSGFEEPVGHHVFQTTGDNKVYGVPEYIVDPVTGKQVSGFLGASAGASIDSLGGAQMGLRVKTDTGAPTDAEYGSVIGTLVYNSFDKTLYVHGPDGTNDWDVV